MVLPADRPLEPGDVVQLIAGDAFNDWGPLLLIVDAVRSWGIECTALIPTHRGTPPGRMPLRVPFVEFERIGRAVFVPEW